MKRLDASALTGGTILAVESPVYPRSMHEPAVLCVEMPDKGIMHVEVWMDPEGNGPGYLYVERVRKAKVQSWTR